MLKLRIQGLIVLPISIFFHSRSRHASEMRSVVAPLTAQQEEQLLSRKLEDTAKHYSGVFAWQVNKELY